MFSTRDRYVDQMRDRLRQGLRSALKAREPIAVNALRSALAAIDNATATDVNAEHAAKSSSQHIAGASAGAYSADASRRELNDSELRAIVEREVDERSRAADEFASLGRDDAADRLLSEASILRAYLA